MNPTEQALWTRLQTYSFDDDPAASLPFRARLARENRWSLAFTGRAITEYKRFAFLAVTAGHPVTPSDQVDQVWHLHLLYTRTYWEDFCPRVLGTPLHHGPTRGGKAEGEKFDDWYARTRESYQRFFGTEPPADLWPEASLRFGRDVHFTRINTQGNWVIPKPAAVSGLLRRALGFFALAAGLLTAGNVHAAPTIDAAIPLLATWNPLDFHGPEFLGFYLILMAVAVVAAVICRNEVWKTLSRDAGRNLPPDGGPDPSLDATEIAYLAGDEPRAVEAAIVSLLQHNLLKLEADQSVSQAGEIDQWPASITDLERDVHGAASTQHDIRSLKKSFRVSAALAKVRQRLNTLGLTLKDDARTDGTLKIRMILAAPLLLGLAKIAVGMSRGKPVGFLVVLCILTVVVACVFPKVGLATERGINLLERLRSRFGQPGSSSVGARFAPADGDLPWAGTAAGALALGVGLYGASALAGSPEFGPMHRAIYPPSDGGGDSGSSSGGDGGGGGCGGGGCGGCGGGGD